jgi:hypothetical protein
MSNAPFDSLNMAMFCHSESVELLALGHRLRQPAVENRQYLSYPTIPTLSMPRNWLAGTLRIDQYKLIPTSGEVKCHV